MLPVIPKSPNPGPGGAAATAVAPRMRCNVFILPLIAIYAIYAIAEAGRSDGYMWLSQVEL